MSEKRKSTPKAKVLTAVLIILFVGSCVAIIFAICTGNLSRTDNTTPTEPQAVTESTAVTEAAAATDATQPTTETAAITETADAPDSKVSLGSTYNVDYWAEYKSEHGSAGLGVLFGAYTQGAVINFEGDRFSVSTLSTYETLDVATGTFSFISDSEIELRYDNSNIEIAKVIETENSVITLMDFPMDVEGTTLRASLSQ